MKLESYRNNSSGALTIHGPGFTVIVETNGHIRTIGQVVVEADAPFAGRVHAAPVNPDIASPRSKPTKKRGSR